jgi:hypothetical protein
MCVEKFGEKGVTIFSSVHAVLGHIAKVPGCRNSGKGFGIVATTYHPGAAEAGGKSIPRTVSSVAKRHASNTKGAEVSTSHGEKDSEKGNTFLI